MLLTITTTHQPATDLGYLLHKHPDRLQSFDLSFGQAHVFYPEVSDQQLTVALLLNVDPVGLVRGKQRSGNFSLAQYVNDRPYVASSLMSVAIAQVFGSALGGRCKDRPQLVGTPLPLTARLEVLPVRGGEEFLKRVFQPLGYNVHATPHVLDDHFPDWGDSPYFSVTISATRTLAELLSHLYVLIPVFDNQKHYYVGDDELEKLLEKGDTWLADHPEKEQITRRYLRNQPSLYREALARLTPEEVVEPADDGTAAEQAEAALEQPLSLNEQRHGAVLAALRGCGAHSVLDLGCSDGKLLKLLLAERQFTRLVGLDVSMQALQRAARRINLERMPAAQRERVTLWQGSLTYRDQRLAGFDAAAVVEVIEHLDPPRLSAFERVLFEFARPGCVVLTTPNREYNHLWETLAKGQFRHADHRFEWTRQEFQEWSTRVAAQYQYTVRLVSVGPHNETAGTPTQMAIFNRTDAQPAG